jgi:hypothetical protein
VKYQLTFVSKKNGRPTRKVIDDKNNDQPQQQIQAGGHSTLTFKVDQNKILKFFGQKAKDAISVLNFMRHIDDLANTNSWTDAVTYTKEAVENADDNQENNKVTAFQRRQNWQGARPKMTTNQ